PLTLSPKQITPQSTTKKKKKITPTPHTTPKHLTPKTKTTPTKKHPTSPPHQINKKTIKIIIFHQQPTQKTQKPPTYSTPLISLHKTKLKSNSTKSSFPTNSTKPIPLTIISLNNK
ncbi:hypothetical protein, partial [Klebsiella pneumoniae]|uniref:hypothetical protein n=1 Tax=Klebsiella pneumoniae TaxID=573 RepID=UPI001C3C797A